MCNNILPFVPKKEEFKIKIKMDTVFKLKTNYLHFILFVYNHGWEWKGSISGVGFWINTIACGHGLALEIMIIYVDEQSKWWTWGVELVILGIQDRCILSCWSTQTRVHFLQGKQWTPPCTKGTFEHDRANGLTFTLVAQCWFLYWRIVHRLP